MFRITRKRLTLSILGLALAVIPFTGQVTAQTNGDSGQTPGYRSGSDMGTTTTRTDRDDDWGFNPGWLGLLGLAGLAGLMPRKTHTVTTHRTGDTAGR